MAEKQKKGEAAEGCFLNRELSWLAFNERVLLEAADSSVPLLERLKFLSIYQSNLDEFYRVRIGILTHRAILTPDKRDELSGLLPEEQIREALRVTTEQQALAESVWKLIRAQLKERGADLLDFKFRLMKWRGYKLVEPPIRAGSCFLKNMEVPTNADFTS